MFWTVSLTPHINPCITPEVGIGVLYTSFLLRLPSKACNQQWIRAYLMVSHMKQDGKPAWPAASAKPLILQAPAGFVFPAQAPHVFTRGAGTTGKPAWSVASAAPLCHWRTSWKYTSPRPTTLSLLRRLHACGRCETYLNSLGNLLFDRTVTCTHINFGLFHTVL